MKLSQVRYPSKFILNDFGKNFQFERLAFGELFHEKLLHVFIFGQELQVFVNFGGQLVISNCLYDIFDEFEWKLFDSFKNLD